MSLSIRFCGAAETVTGSRHLLEHNGKNILIDCGLFQGQREIRERNWEPFPIRPHEIDAIVITHAHMDHIGNLPRLVTQGYRGPIFATPATIGLARISLPDSGRLQEDEARHRNKHGLTRHKPALPLYTEVQAYECMKRFEPIGFEVDTKLPGGASWQYIPNGHILGSAFVQMDFPEGVRLLMSGDVGRYDQPLLVDPIAIPAADYLVTESTYGDRIHSTEDPEEKLAAIMNDAAQSGACIIVPTFAIGRTQDMFYFIKRLQDAGKVPAMPIFLDSPMASEATVQYLKFTDEYDKEAKLALTDTSNPIKPADLHFVRSSEESKSLNDRRGPMMIISGSGMMNGGRVVHHLLHRASDPNTIVLITGYQAEGTLGREFVDKKQEVRILGQMVPVRARVEKLNSLSAHADQGELLRWMRGFESPPRKTFIVHGEPPAQAGLASKIEHDLGWQTVIPHHLERFQLE